jgi:hypothetical protein
MNKNHFKFFCAAANGFIEQYKYNGYVEELFDDPLLIPCQSTGITDSKGNDVYENDILNIKGGFEDKRGKVTFKHGSFVVEFLEPSSTMNFAFLYQIGVFEVIGCALEKKEKQ